MTIHVQLNHAPVAVASSAVTDIGHSHSFAVSDFHFTDLTDPSEPLKAVIIDTLPQNGTLTLTLPGAFPMVLDGQHGPTTIQASDLQYLVYTPTDGFSGPDPFNFRVQDSGGTAGAPQACAVRGETAAD